MKKDVSILKKFDYKWIVISLCFMMVFTCLGFCSSNRSLYVVAITEALDISRSEFSISDSFRFIATAIVNLFFGNLVARFGTKKLICAGFISLIVSCLIYATAPNVFMFCVAGTFLGIGLSWTTTTMVGCVVNKWCKENRGTIMGFILASNGIGGAVAAQIITPIIYNENNIFGYRNAYLLVTLILVIVGVLVVVFFKEQPKDYDNSEPVVTKKKHRGQSWVGIEFSKAKKMPFFYIACVCIFFTGFVLHGINGVAAAHMSDVGVSASYIATVLSVHSLSLTLFKFLTGLMYDKSGLRVTMTVCCLAGVLTMVLLAVISNSTSGMIFAMIYGVISSLALPLETIMLPIYAGDLFGDKSLDKIMGVFISVNTTGYALGGPFMNLIYDISGSYMPAFVLCAIAMIAVTVVMQFVLNSSLKVRNSITENDCATV